MRCGNSPSCPDFPGACLEVDSIRQFLDACDHKSCTNASDLARFIWGSVIFFRPFRLVTGHALAQAMRANESLLIENARNGHYGNYNNGLQIAESKFIDF